MSTVLVVKAAYDADARVWYVESSDIPGLNLEAPSLEALRDKIPGAALDLFEADGVETEIDLPIEVIAHAATRLRAPAAA